VRFEFLSEYCLGPHKRNTTLLIGYAQSSETSLRSGVRTLAETIRGLDKATRADR